MIEYDESQVLIEITPTTLFKEAFNEHNAFIRLQKLGQAIEKITDVLPFEEKSELIIKEKELTRFLFYTRIIIPDQMEMLLDSLYSKFGQNPQFLENCWGSLEYFADLPASHITNTKDSVNLNEYENKVLSIKILDYKCAYVFKKWALNYSLQIFDTIIVRENNQLKYIKIKDAMFLNRNDPLIFFMHLIKNSEEQEILKDVCNALEQIKQKYNFLWLHKDVDEKIQEIFMEKSSKYYSPPEIKRIGFEFEKKKDKEQNDEKKFERSQNRYQTGLNTVAEKTGLNLFINQDSDDEIVDGRNKRESSINEFVGEFPKQLEYWLFEVYKGLRQFLKQKKIDNLNLKILYYNQNFKIIFYFTLIKSKTEKLMIQKNDYIMESFRMYENVQILLSFIINPKQYQVSRKWAKAFPDLHYHIEHPIFYTPTFRCDLQEQYDNKPKYYNSCFLRSHRAVQIIKNINNFKFLMSGAINIVEIFFSDLYCLFQNNQINVSANMEHVGSLMIFFLIQDSESTLSMMIEYNMLFNLIPFVDIPSINNFLQKIFCVNFVSKPDVSIETYEKFWQYTKTTQFFEELSKMMLYCDSSKLNMFKCENMYKSHELYELLKSIKKVDINKINFQFNKFIPYWPENDYTFRVDIDQIRVHRTRTMTCKLRKAIDSQKKGSEKFGSLVLKEILPSMRKGSNKIIEEQRPYSQSNDYKQRKSENEHYKEQTITLKKEGQTPSNVPKSRASFLEKMGSLKNDLKDLPIVYNNHKVLNSIDLQNNQKLQTQKKSIDINENLRISIHRIQDCETPLNEPRVKSQYVTPNRAQEKKLTRQDTLKISTSVQNLSIMKDAINQRLAQSNIRNRFLSNYKKELNISNNAGKSGISILNKVNNNDQNTLKNNQVYNSKILFTINPPPNGSKSETVLRINSLYPLSLKQISQTPKEIQCRKFQSKDLLINDRYSMSIANLFLEIYKNIIEQEQNTHFYTLLKLVKIDYSYLLSSVFNERIFDDIESNFLQEQSQKILNIIERYFALQQKIIMNSYAWSSSWLPNQIKIGKIEIDCVNSYKIDILKNMRLFFNLISEDKKKQYVKLIYESTWSAILQLSFENRFNNILQQEIFQILKIAINYLDSAGMINIWVKLNIFDFFIQQLDIILINNKFNISFGMDAFYLSIKQIVQAIYDTTLLRQFELQQFIICINTLESWKNLKLILLKIKADDNLSIMNESLNLSIKKMKNLNLQQNSTDRSYILSNRSNQQGSSLPLKSPNINSPEKSHFQNKQREVSPNKYYYSGLSTTIHSAMQLNNNASSCQADTKNPSSSSLSKIVKFPQSNNPSKIQNMSQIDKQSAMNGQNTSNVSTFNNSNNTSMQFLQGSQSNLNNTKTSLKSEQRTNNISFKNQTANPSLLKFRIVQNSLASSINPISSKGFNSILNQNNLSLLNHKKIAQNENKYH